MFSIIVHSSLSQYLKSLWAGLCSALLPLSLAHVVCLLGCTEIWMVRPFWRWFAMITVWFGSQCILAGGLVTVSRHLDTQ